MAKVATRTTLELWKDIVFALLIRQLQSKFNDKFGVAWLILQPVSFVIILSLLRGQMDGDSTHEIPTFIFMALGFVTVLQFLSAWASTSSSIRKDKPLYAFRQVQPVASIITAAIIEFITNVVVLIVICCFCYLLRFELKIDDPLWVLIFLIEVQVIAYSLGLILGVSGLFIQEVVKVESLLKRPILFISCTFFSLNDMPQETWKYLAWNPIVHAVELARSHSYSNFNQVNIISENYLHMSTLILFFTALLFYFGLWKKGISR